MDNVREAQQKKVTEPQKRRRKEILFPKRKPSVVIQPTDIVYITPGETTCKECKCFPREEPYTYPKKLTKCQKGPLTLYELCARVVDGMPTPSAFHWDIEDVCEWMANTVGFPHYQECIRDNSIDGRRLLMLADPSVMPAVNIHYHVDIQHITRHVRELFGTEFLYFTRSIGLPPLKPWTHVILFKSRTGPRFGWRQGMSPTDILRWMKILMPWPKKLHHWERVWYIPADFPKVKFARPHCKLIKRRTKEICQEYEAPRKFRIMPQIKDEHQKIWKEHRPGSADPPPAATAELTPLLLIEKVKKLMPTTGDLMLDRRRRPRTKYLT